ncbi:hypothetical protein KKG29_03145 [Patescibacteria group bacterium]|nr:hypothetical protein [Patescibacteria group bacterium]MBU4000143.1 hypothetical protein [Patescibacteria group bacterium]MBU4057241.1 hypothetical protein [Patescibacteria group bacterium]MBU4368904.1 hypothetical protein [Patescibacteria group bacterium]
MSVKEFRNNLKLLEESGEIQKLVGEKKVLKAFEIARRAETFPDERIFLIVRKCLGVSQDEEIWKEALKQEIGKSGITPDKEQTDLIASIRGSCAMLKGQKSGVDVVFFLGERMRRY